MKLLVVGDTHNNARWFHHLITSNAGKVDRIVQVGDFGFIWPQASRENVLRKLNGVLEDAGIDLLFLPGNHEDHTRLLRYEAEAERNVDGHLVIRPRISYAGRYSAWTWSGKRFAAVGGAVSIDRDFRVAEERRTGTPIWWPAEVLSPAELARARGLGSVDVLFTHDAPSSFPAVGLKPDLSSTAYRQEMTLVGRALVPKLWFHGHYHRKVTYAFYHDEGICEVRCLDCDGMNPKDSTALLDLSYEVELIQPTGLTPLD